jgi:hypothetical protein
MSDPDRILFFIATPLHLHLHLRKFLAFLNAVFGLLIAYIYVFAKASFSVTLNQRDLFVPFHSFFIFRGDTHAGLAQTQFVVRRFTLSHVRRRFCARYCVADGTRG